MASGNSAMVLEQGSGWTRGLRNMLGGELTAWFGTNKWWRQILMWAGIINVIYAASAPTISRNGDTPVMLFCIFAGLTGTIGATIMMQMSVIGEKRAGTAAWLLSKPLSRPAFIASKLVASAVGIGVTMVLAQGVIAYLVTGFLVGVWLPPLGFLAGLGALFLSVLFYLTLTLILGVLVDRPGLVIGIPLLLMGAQNLVGPQLAQLSSAIAQALPWNLFAPLGGTGMTNSVATALMLGQPAPLVPVYTALVACVVFVAVAVLVFRRQEL